MVLGVGIDIVSIARVKDAVETGGKAFLDKVFTTQEHRQAETHGNPIAYYAMMFSSKEAILKAFAIDWETGVQWTEIEIKRGDFGEPIPIQKGALDSKRDQKNQIETISAQVRKSILELQTKLKP